MENLKLEAMYNWVCDIDASIKLLEIKTSLIEKFLRESNIENFEDRYQLFLYEHCQAEKRRVPQSAFAKFLSNFESGIQEAG